MKHYIEYILKCISWLNSLSRSAHINRMWLYFDYIGALISHGCLIRQYVIGNFWKLSPPERKKRLTYRRIVELYEKFNQQAYVRLLNDKPEFNRYFSNFVKREWLHSTEITKEQFVQFLEKQNAVILKPVGGVNGDSIKKFVLSEHPDIDLDKYYAELKNADVMIEEIIIQHPRMIFGNTSVNSIRTFTFLDKHGRAHVLKAILRAGVGNSVVDNYSQGGAIYEVNLETGLICTYGQSKQNTQSYIHPGTNIVMLGYQVPNWEKVIEASKKAAESLPQVRFIGWDVAITQDGVDIIEGNHNPGYELMEFLGSTGYYEKINRLHTHESPQSLRTTHS